MSNLQETTAFNTRHESVGRPVGSIAARAQAWEKSNNAGYVTIGSIRYGIRFASHVSGKDIVPSRGSFTKQSDEKECCCGVWPRAGAPPSKIPLPNTEKSQSIYKRCVSSKSEAPVSSVNCFAGVEHGGDMKTLPSPSLRQRIFVRPPFRFGGNSSTDSETSRLLQNSDQELSVEGGSGTPLGNTLDKLQKFRFGGGESRKKRSGDKTERLRELTDMLRGRTPASPDRKKPPPIPGSSPPSKLPTKQNTGSTLRNFFGSSVSLSGSQNETEASTSCEPERGSSVTSTETMTPSETVTLTDTVTQTEPPDSEVFECDDKLRKAESRPIVGSYTQRTIPFRSASFSQVDFDSTDGKYTRHNKDCRKVNLPNSGALTFPRKTHADASTSVSPPPGKIFEEITSSTPSVDSAVGSDEGFVLGSSSNVSNMSESHKIPGSRSLTYPLGKKSKLDEDDLPFSSIDGNGLRSLQNSSAPLVRELSDVSEETSESVLVNVDKVDSVGVVYQCTVQEYPVVINTISSQSEDMEEEKDVLTPLNTPEKELSESLTPEANNKPEIYVTTWPKENEDVPELTGEGKKVEADPGEENNGETNDPCQSPDEILPKLEWKDRPKLSCQSSEEREDDIAPTARRPYQLLSRADSLSEGDSDQGERRLERDRTSSPSPLFSSVFDLSDNESKSWTQDKRGPRRYPKRPLRGPYGQMLEAEMKKPETDRKKQMNEDLKFLEDFMPPKRSLSPINPSRPASESRLNTSPRPRANTHSLDDSQLRGLYSSSPKRKVSANIPFSGQKQTGGVVVCHQRTTSSPSQLEGYTSTPSPSPSPVTRRSEVTQELLAELLKGSSERLFMCDDNNFIKDTRTHVVVELFDTERSYVESLQIIVLKYLQPLKSPENAGLVDLAVVDEIFYQIPSILMHHEQLLDEFRKRLEQWDIKQKIGDVLLDSFTKATMIESYTSFINNWTTAKEAIKVTSQQKPTFAKFLETMAREHKGKLGLDQLLIKPVQRIPRYELLIQRLLKHTDPNHPDHALLQIAQQHIHDLAVKINLTERETLEMEQQQQTLRDIEALIEGLVDLTSSDRTYVRHDAVTMASGQGTRKERALFLFSDLLVITSIKRRSGTIRKPSTACAGSIASTLDANKYKLLMKINLDDLEVVKSKDENLKKLLREIERLTEDVATLTQITDHVITLHCPHSTLEELVKEMLTNVNKQLAEKQSADSQLSHLELTLNTSNGIENISVVFACPDKRTSWEESFSEAKQKLAISMDKRPTPEFVAPVPIRKTRAGLQFTCASPTLGLNPFNLKDVWVCNSDGYVGQVCVLSLQPEPTVTSCNGVCNARILSVASIPAGTPNPPSKENERVKRKKTGVSISVQDADGGSGNIQLDSSSSSEEEEEIQAQETQEETESKRVVANDTGQEETDNQAPTMWLGTEDGNIHVYNCTDNIRIKKNKVKLQHGSSVYCIKYLDNRVFVSLANGDISVYTRDAQGGWNTMEPQTLTVGTAVAPVTKMLPVSGKLWCGCYNMIKILNTSSLVIENSFQVDADTCRVVTGMTSSGLGVWVAQQNSAIIKLFHSGTYDYLTDVNVAPAVTKVLTSCDDIIRQHKAACLRVTSLLACKDLLWVGTSAGVILTMPLPHITQSTSKVHNLPTVIGLPYGHTGHVRFLTCVETTPSQPENKHRYSLKNKTDLQPPNPTTSAKLLVISGGDGYEDFRNSNISEVAGREDSTNHLLMWHV